MPAVEINEPDHLRVLTTSLPVVQESRQVRIATERLADVAELIAKRVSEPPVWEDELHFRDGTWRTAGWVLVLDALNFCFWSERADPNDRWRVEWQGRSWDGYWALAAALSRAVADGRELWESRYLVSVSEAEVAEILRPESGSQEIPLASDRVRNLRELGAALEQFGGGQQGVERLIGEAQGSAVSLVETVARVMPSFNDVATWRGEGVRLFKRAQILVGDLHGAFGGEGLGRFDDLDQLTAFADYKVPQVLRRFGLLDYSPELTEIIGKRQLIPAGSETEIEIRAATIWAVELLRRELVANGVELPAFEIDWALWLAGQSLPSGEPYHRTLTTYY